MSVLSVHKGSKVVLSLCVCRLPSRYVEPAFAKKFREWREDFRQRTDSRLNIADGLVYLRTPGHFLPSIDERPKNQQRLQNKDQDTGSGSPVKQAKLHVSEIDELLESEGIPELEAMKSKSIEDGKKGDLKSDAKQKSKQSENLDSESMLYLVVRYKHAPEVWTFPFTNRVETDSAFNTLKRLCAEQIGMKPHFPSLSPIAYRKLPGTSEDTPHSRIFYYKGVFVPKSHEVRLPHDSEITEYAWVNRAALKDRLTVASWKTVRDALPID